jgi:hypothetical protein
MTIARVKIETELSRFESFHVCDPVNLYRVSQSYALRPAIFFVVPNASKMADFRAPE